jgi:hypothetical protein
MIQPTQTQADGLDGSDGFDGLHEDTPMNRQDGSDGLAGLGGSLLGPALEEVSTWLNRFISVTDPRDINLLTLWIAHTHAALELYSTPRLIIDSSMPGSGKTTVLEHIYRLGHQPVQAASLSSPALLARMLSKGIRTILIDEADRSLDPKKPGVEDFIAIINSGYKRGATRPVLVPTKDGWNVDEMPTFSPVVLAGNSPHLPDDTRSRAIRLLLMPDLGGTVETSDWEELEDEAKALGTRLAEAIDECREFLRTARPSLPAGCIGRSKERWSPLMRVATAAGGSWPAVTADLIERDLLEVQQEREDGLSKLPPAVVILTDLGDVWPASPFASSTDLANRLANHNPDQWAETSAFGKRMTVQRLGRMLSQAFKIYSRKNAIGTRGYYRSDLETAWRRFGIGTQAEPPEASEPPEPSVDGSPGSVPEPPRPSELSEPSKACRVCGGTLHAPGSRAVGVCGKTDLEHKAARGETA